MKRLLALALILLLLLPAAWAENADVDAYFEDAAFIGDSMMGQIGRYRREQNQQGNEIFPGAKVLYSGAYSLYLGSQRSALDNSPAMVYRGQRLSLPEAVYQLDVSKVFIMLGRCDNPGVPEHLDRLMRYWTRIFDRIREKRPDIEIIAISVPPLAEKYETKTTRQLYFDNFNRALEALCAEMDVVYCDIATPLKTADGYLNQKNAKTDGVHFSEAGVIAFIDAMYDFARSQVAKPSE
mgnify:FL=1